MHAINGVCACVKDNGGVVTPRGAAGIPNGRVPVNGIPNGRVPVNGTVLPPYIPAIDEAPEINKTVRINSPPNMGEVRYFSYINVSQKCRYSVF